MRIPRTPALVAAGVVLAGVAVVAIVLAGGRGDEPAAEPTPTPTPTASPTTEPTPTPTPTPPPEAEPFDLRVREDGLRIASADNAPILSAPSLEVDTAAAEQAAEAARERLEAFLDAQFTDRDTWFGDAAVDGLLTERARAVAGPRSRAALGVVDLDVDHVVTGRAETDAVVTMHGAEPRTVALRFVADLTAVLADDSELPLRFEGQAVFVPTGDDWAAEAIDANLVEQQPADGADPTPTEGASS